MRTHHFRLSNISVRKFNVVFLSLFFFCVGPFVSLAICFALLAKPNRDPSVFRMLVAATNVYVHKRKQYSSANGRWGFGG